MNIWAQAAAIVVSMAVLDFVWAQYTFAMTAKHSMKAGGYASAIILLGGIGAIGYTSNHWLLIPAMIGAFIGTSSAVKFSKTSISFACAGSKWVVLGKSVLTCFPQRLAALSEYVVTKNRGRCYARGRCARR